MRTKILLLSAGLALAIVLSVNLSLRLTNKVENGHMINLGPKTAFAKKDVGCYNGYTYDCHTWSVYGISFSAGSGYNCNFTGSFGPPYICTDRNCNESFKSRKCVQGTPE